jgi:transposase
MEPHMSQKSSAPTTGEVPAKGGTKSPPERLVRDIRRATRKHHSPEDKIRIVLEGLRGEESIAALCRREGIAESLYYTWSKEFLEAGKRRLAGDTARAATTDEVKALRQEARSLKEVVAEQALELRLLKTYGPPRLQAAFAFWSDQSTPTYPASETRSQPRWRAARPGPHKSTGVRAPFFSPGFRNAGRLSGHLACTARRPQSAARAG